jgi:hypothetical protein
LAKRSVNLPLPSSPHWVPTMIVAGTGGDVTGWPRAPDATDPAPAAPGPKVVRWLARWL